MTTTTDKVHTGIITQADLTLGVSTSVPKPKLLSGRMILVKVRAVAINPTDFKMPAAFPSPGAVDGTDFAGDVVAIGDQVTKWKIGDRVFGACQGANPKNHQAGAFQEICPNYEDDVLRIPDDMSYETAAGIGGACVGTAALALYCSLGLSPLPPWPEESGEASEPTPSSTPPVKPVHVLINGGSTATGVMAVQLVRLSGHIPIATCSPHNFDLVKSYGAVAVFDYHSSTCAADIRAFTGNKLGFALDGVTTPASIKLCYGAIGRMGGRYTAVEQPPPDLISGMRRVVKMDWVMGLTMTGRPIELGKGYEFPVMAEHVEFARRWMPLCQRLIETGRLRPHPIRLSEDGGWAAILDGLQLLRAKKVSGEKLVYRIC